MHLMIIGIFLGWGAAIPLGPINIEMIRRNLTFGFRSGIALGIGATTADATYLVLLMLGALIFLTHLLVLAVVGIVGAVILAYFGWRNIVSQPSQKLQQLRQRKFLAIWLSGYVITLLNPMTIIFWSSISSQIASITLGRPIAIIFVALGVILGTLSWSFLLNSMLHFTRHKINQRALRIFNLIGGSILIIFAIIGLLHSIQLLLTA